MAKLSWKKLSKADFKSVPPVESVGQAIDVLRDTSKMKILPGITTAGFSRDMRDILSEAIWNDTKNAIKHLGGPNVPSYAEVNGVGKLEIGLSSLKRIWKLNGESYAPSSQVEVAVIAMATCASQRIRVIRTTSLGGPEDFWVRLLLSDLHALLVPLVPKECEYLDY